MQDQNQTTIDTMNESELRAYCEMLVKERNELAQKLAHADEPWVDLYHPEFGSEWQEGGVIGNAIMQAHIDQLDEVVRLIAPPENAAETECPTAIAMLRRVLIAKSGGLKDHLRGIIEHKKFRQALKNSQKAVTG